MIEVKKRLNIIDLQSKSRLRGGGGGGGSAFDITGGIYSYV